MSLGALPSKCVYFLVQAVKLSLLLASDCLLFIDLPVDLSEPGGFEVQGHDLLDMARYHGLERSFKVLRAKARDLLDDHLVEVVETKIQMGELGLPLEKV